MFTRETTSKSNLIYQELKLLLRFLQKSSDEQIEQGEEREKFPFKSHIIHIISSMAKGSGFEVVSPAFYIYILYLFVHFSPLCAKKVDITKVAFQK